MARYVANASVGLISGGESKRDTTDRKQSQRATMGRTKSMHLFNCAELLLIS